MKIDLKNIKIPNIILNHIKVNLKEYIIVLLMFVIGIFLGVMFLNNAKNEDKEEITKYINDYIAQVKENPNNTINLNLNVKSNIILGFCLWFAGTTLIGIPIVFAIILYRGFCLGYTISVCTYTMGISKGLAFVFMTMVMQNLILIPAIFAIGVSGIKLYKSVMKDKRRENIKLEILRHTVVSSLMICALICSAVVKINVSGLLTKSLIKYF